MLTIPKYIICVHRLVTAISIPLVCLPEEHAMPENGSETCHHAVSRHIQFLDSGEYQLKNNIEGWNSSSN